MNTNIDPSTTKYLIRAALSAEGVVEKPDVVGAIFGQTEGLLGNELDLRDLQKSGRIGRIEVLVDSKKGKSTGEIILPSSLDKVETVILAAALESIDRVGPCKADIKVQAVEDVRVAKRKQVVDRAKQLLEQLQRVDTAGADDISELVRDTIRVEEIVSYGPDRLPAGPNVAKSDSILVVEGRNDVLNLLKNGIKNAIAVEGTSVPPTIAQLCKEKTSIAFVDGDRGGELILKELLQMADVDFIARAPRAQEVEELSQKQIMKCLRNKIPAEQFAEMYALEGGQRARETRDNVRGRGGPQRGREERGRGRDDREERPRGREQERDERPPKREEREERAPPKREEREERAPKREDRDEGGEERGRGRARERRERREQRQREREQVDEADEEEEEEPQAPAAPARGNAEQKYLEILDELAGKLQAVLLTDALERVGEPIAVRELADTLKTDEGKKVKHVVFDGVVTQRLLDIAADKGIDTLVGVKTGNITKAPDSVEVLTRNDIA